MCEKTIFSKNGDGFNLCGKSVLHYYNNKGYCSNHCNPSNKEYEKPDSKKINIKQKKNKLCINNGIIENDDKFIYQDSEIKGIQKDNQYYYLTDSEDRGIIRGNYEPSIFNYNDNSNVSEKIDFKKYNCNYKKLMKTEDL